MQTATLGTIGRVSRLTLGGGGIGQVWGDTSREEAIATLRVAVEEGIDVIDAAPGYKVCEELIGEAFDGRLPAGVRITTKCGVVTVAPGEVYGKLRASLEKSLKDMRLERVDLMFLHNEVSPDDFVYPEGNEKQGQFASPWSLYREAIIPAFERLVSEGLIGAWGITGVSVPEAILRALSEEPRPAVVQAVANLLDSPGGLMRRGMGPSQRSREIIASAAAQGVGVMGIRAVQAGALTVRFDRPMDADNQDLPDFNRAAPFRDLCRQWGQSPAIVAHRYALAMEGVDTVVLGVKNVAELREALAAEAAGPLEAERVAAIDALGLRA